jgi:hypothetical protein
VRLQPLGHLSGVNRWEGTFSQHEPPHINQYAGIACSILWVCLRNPQLEEWIFAESNQEIFSPESALVVDEDADEETDPEAPAAAAFAAAFVGAEAGSAGILALSTTW